MPRRNNGVDEQTGADAAERRGSKRRGPKKKAPRPQQREEFLDAMDLRRQYREDLLKEIHVSYEPLPTDQQDRVRIKREEFLQVQDSVYYYWWLFVQGGMQFPSDERNPLGDPDITRTLAAFGNLNLSFELWWERTGRRMFAEKGELPLIQVVEIDEDFDVRDPEQFPKHITVKIPLTIPAIGIERQLEKILEVCHPGNALKVHESSTADVKIYAKKEAQVAKLAKYLRVWTAVEEENRNVPNPELRRRYWEIGRDLGYAAGINLEGDYTGSSVNRTNLQTEIRDIYEKTNRIVANALRGKFPKT
jgi:hypothetical protein